MSRESEINAENDFRERYAAEIRKMADQQLNDERQRVKHQAMKTPGRRGEYIKHEEIDKELVRRHILKEKERRNF
jgi:hypothetical protein